jgi:hypothetical protein
MLDRYRKEQEENRAPAKPPRRGTGDPVGNVIMLAALAVGAYVWFHALRALSIPAPPSPRASSPPSSCLVPSRTL